jgi:hypothetical protein
VLPVRRRDIEIHSYIKIDASSRVSILHTDKAIASLVSKSIPEENNDQATIFCCSKNLARVEEAMAGCLRLLRFYNNRQAFKNGSIHSYIEQGKNGSILFTSRHGDSARLRQLIKVSTMTEEESLDFLIQGPLSSTEEICHHWECGVQS